MKRFQLSALIATAVLLVGAATLAQAHDFDRIGSFSHPIRYVALILHPIGMAGEYVIERPVHYLVSQPDLDVLFGHKAYPDEKFFEWTHGDGSRGVAPKPQAAKPKPAPQPAEQPPAE